MHNLYRNTILLLTMLAAVACGNKRTYFPHKLQPEHIEVVRFDSALLSVDTANIYPAVQALYENYPTFMPIFVEDILGIDISDTAYLCEALPLFLNDTIYGFKQTNQLVAQKFADISDILKPMQLAMARYKYIYPDAPIPKVYFFISGFNASLFFFDEDMFTDSKSYAVGVDMYLGSDYEYYNQVVYNYQKQTMRKECIPLDLFAAYLFQQVPYLSEQTRLIDNMIYRGKVMYLLSQLFPQETEAEVMGYTDEQFKWCKRHEAAIWNMMIDKRDLFKTESLVLTSYLNDGPFTSEISQDSPARLGVWIGWQIVKNYMENNPQVSMQQLLAEPDAQLILQDSRYRP